MTRDIFIAILSVRLSVRRVAVLKRFNVFSYFLHHIVAQPF